MKSKVAKTSRLTSNAADPASLILCRSSYRHTLSAAKLLCCGAAYRLIVYHRFLVMQIHDVSDETAPSVPRSLKLSVGLKSACSSPAHLLEARPFLE